jgi:hypothetical protein
MGRKSPPYCCDIIQTALKDLNVSRQLFRRNRNYTSFYNKETKELVGHLYSQDVSAFDYSFGD